MAKDRDKMFRDFVTPYLEPDEKILHAAYGVKQPHILLIILFICLAIIPGMIVVLLMTKHYVVALTDRRFVVINCNQRMTENKEQFSYDPRNLGGEFKSSTGGLFTHMKIDNIAQPFKAKFHRAGSKQNRENAMAIAAALANPKAQPVI